MRNRDRIIPFISAGIIAVLLLLAIGINSLQMLPGRPFYLGDPGQMSTGGSDLSGDPNNIVMLIFRVIMIGAAVILPVALLLGLSTPDGRRQLLAYLIMGGMLVLAYSLLQGSARNTQDTQVAKQAVAQETATLEATRLPTDVFSPTTPDWLVTAVSIAIGMAVCGIMAAVIYIAWRRSRQPQSALQELAAEAQHAMQALQAGEDLKDVVLRCYREMSRVLQTERGIQRQAAMTAREFEMALSDKGVPAEPVHQLTSLFEKVRYGHEPPASHDEQLAISSLSTIVAACSLRTPSHSST